MFQESMKVMSASGINISRPTKFPHTIFSRHAGAKCFENPPLIQLDPCGSRKLDFQSDLDLIKAVIISGFSDSSGETGIMPLAEFERSKPQGYSVSVDKKE